MKPNDILAAILREVRKDVDPIPPGYMSMKELAKAWRMPIATAKDHVDKGLAKGVLHRIKLRVLGASGHKTCAYFYKAGPAPKCRTPNAKG